LQDGSKSAHAADISSIKTGLSRWNAHWTPPYSPVLKHEMGFRHPECGKWLCPIDLDWDDAQVAQDLRSGKKVALPEDYHRGLYFGEDPDPNDLMTGFLRGEQILRGYNSIFISPSTALSESGTDKSTGKGIAAHHGISTATLESVIYVAHILHFCLSSQATFQAKGGNGLFSYRRYFKNIQVSVRQWPEEEQENLLTWWNEYVFCFFVFPSLILFLGKCSLARMRRLLSVLMEL
ncbi:hypothetical protein R3P38DRAFT_2586681, partial [Favolaschia claudopus]